MVSSTSTDITMGLTDTKRIDDGHKTDLILSSLLQPSMLEYPSDATRSAKRRTLLTQVFEPDASEHTSPAHV